MFIFDTSARYKWCFEPDQSLKQAGKQTFENEVLPRWLGQMLTILNQGKGKFMTGDEVSLCLLIIFEKLLRY